MIINTNDLIQTDITYLSSIVSEYDRNNFLMLPGQEHYRLLAYLSTLMNGVLIADIGTRYGSSAIALSHNPTNMVHSYDIIPCGHLTNLKSNIRFCQENIWENLLWTLPYSLISLDIDPHEGQMEREMIEFLQQSHYAGIVILDDIGHDWPKMQDMWNNISGITKYDITHIGHFSGTGLLAFNIDITII